MKKTYICIVCRHKFSLDIQWMIDDIEIEHHRKICTTCQNRMMREAVYGDSECKCINCMN